MRALVATLVVRERRSRNLNADAIRQTAAVKARGELDGVVGE